MSQTCKMKKSSEMVDGQQRREDNTFPLSVLYECVCTSSDLLSTLSLSWQGKETDFG